MPDVNLNILLRAEREVFSKEKLVGITIGDREDIAMRSLLIVWQKILFLITSNRWYLENNRYN